MSKVDKSNLYHYKATVNRVIDGDTVNLTIDLGFTILWKSNCRLAGVNTPELTSVDETVRAKANEAKQYAINRLIPTLGRPSEVFIISKVLDVYGRPVVDLYYGPQFEFHLNQELLDKGLAEILKY